MTILAFLMPAAAQKAEVKTPPAMPDFSKPAWYTKVLDLRPARWSLKNNPDQWTWDGYRLFHRPSNHSFRDTGITFLGWRVSADCSCNSSQAGVIDRFLFNRAFKRWYRSYWKPLATVRAAERSAEMNKQFAGHFVKAK
jgi:hypothetical protein